MREKEQQTHLCIVISPDLLTSIRSLNKVPAFRSAVCSVLCEFTVHESGTEYLKGTAAVLGGRSCQSDLKQERRGKNTEEMMEAEKQTNVPDVDFSRLAWIQ
jgi:hypothetical protein